MERLEKPDSIEGPRSRDSFVLSQLPDLQAEYLRLSTRGRTTGLPHIVKLRYVWSRGSFYVISGSAKSDWVLNVIKRCGGQVRISDFLYEVSAKLLVDEEERGTLEEFRLKYGRALVEKWYARSHTFVSLTPVAGPVRRGFASGELEAKTTLSDWRKSETDYYSAVASAFDSAAEEYDFTINHNFINTWIRRRSIEVLLSRVNPDDFLLEIGAGTGAEAIEIAKHVRGLVAIDVSQSMVDILATKVRARHLETKVFPARVAASELSRIQSHLAGKKVRVSYSFNGALNCEPRLEEFVAQLVSLLEPRGIFVCSVRNTLCLAEAVSHAAVFQFNRLNPRKHQPIMVSVGGRDIPSTYYSPRDFARMFKPHFETEEVIALPGLLPPAYLNDYYLKLRGLTSVVERLDRTLSGHFPLNRYGDQTLFVFRKNPR